MKIETVGNQSSLGTAGEMLVAYDGSPAARRALVHAAALVGRGGRVAVVNVIPVQSVSARLETVSDRQRARQAEVLRGAIALVADRGVRVRAIPAIGDPLTEILDIVAADDGPRILVVGRNGGRVRHLLHCSLAMRLARAAKCDVLVVH